MSIAINELKAMDFTFLKRNPEEQDYINNQKKEIERMEKSEEVSLDNKEANKQKLLETANLLRSAQGNEIPADTSDKSNVRINNKKYLHGIISKLSGEAGELNLDDSKIIYAALSGTYLEDDKDSLKRGILDNINRYFHRAYVDYLADLWIDGRFPYNKDILKFINLFPYPGPYDSIYYLRDWTLMLLICARFRIMKLIDYIYFWLSF